MLRRETRFTCYGLSRSAVAIFLLSRSFRRKQIPRRRREQEFARRDSSTSKLLDYRGRLLTREKVSFLRALAPRRSSHVSRRKPLSAARRRLIEKVAGTIDEESMLAINHLGIRPRFDRRTIYKRIERRLRDRPARLRQISSR